MYEVALGYTNALRLADSAHLFKTIAKKTGGEFGIVCCFMAKPYESQPGCSGHLHFSLNSQKTSQEPPRNLFADDKVILARFVAGVLMGLPSIMCILAPNVNSYKRLVENYWVFLGFNHLGAIDCTWIPTKHRRLGGMIHE